jgi:hypothetical protein
VPGELATGIARMVPVLPAAVRRDLRHLLSHEVAAPAPELERAARLDLLCALVERRMGEIPTVEEYEHERVHHRRAPSAATLSRRYGGWLRAVATAAWLGAGGSGAPPATAAREAQPRYSRAEAITALESCRCALGAWPTPAEYEEWRRLRLRLQRRFGDGRSRMPSLCVFRRLFGGMDAGVSAAKQWNT